MLAHYAKENACQGQQRLEETVSETGKHETKHATIQFMVGTVPNKQHYTETNCRVLLRMLTASRVLNTSEYIGDASLFHLRLLQHTLRFLALQSTVALPATLATGL